MVQCELHRTLLLKQKLVGSTRDPTIFLGEKENLYYSAGGNKTVSITWITPLSAMMSVRMTIESLM